MPPSRRLVPLAACLLLSALPSPAVPLQAGRDRPLLMKSGSFDPQEGLPASSELPGVAAYEVGVKGGYLVQFDHPIGEAEIRAVRQAGARVVGFVPTDALEVVMDESARAGVARLPGV